MSYLPEKLFTTHLILRKNNKLDIPFLHYCTSVAEANGSYLTVENVSFDTIRARDENDYYWNDNSKTCIIETKQTNKSIGVIHYWKDPTTPSCALVTLKIALDEYRNRGYGTEAQVVFVKSLFDYCHFDQVAMFTDIENIAQQKCLSKLGFNFVDSASYNDFNIERTGKYYRVSFKEYQHLEIYKY